MLPICARSPMDVTIEMMDNLAMPPELPPSLNELAMQLSAHSVGHFARQPDHDTVRDRAPDHLLIWVLAGRGHAETEGSKIDAAAGDLLSFLPGEAHHYRSSRTDPWEIYWTHFGGTLAGRYMDAVRHFGSPFIRLGIDPTLKNSFDDLIVAMGENPGTATRRNRIDILTGQMLAALIGRMVHNLAQPAPSPPATADGFDTTAVRRHIQRHLTEPLTLEQLAQASNLSATHFSRLFRRHLGVSPMHYVIQQRMARAATT